ncbi:hypothetical protein [Acidiphilium acidophilum]|uniref:hypothetical protein n=1 Tax=Acidiphilium acidophilum TaxID=76588 RepID=UPI002E8E7896|nr:hypothetical protein [Acidiphilium acidophilum]
MREGMVGLLFNDSRRSFKGGERIDELMLRGWGRVGEECVWEIEVEGWYFKWGNEEIVDRKLVI